MVMFVIGVPWKFWLEEKHGGATLQKFPQNLEL